MKTFELNNNAIHLLIAMAKYSENTLCKNRAKFYLSSASPEEKLRVFDTDGSLMQYCVKGNPTKATWNASATSQRAMTKAFHKIYLDNNNNLKTN